MIRVGFVLTLCVFGNIAYNLDRDLEAMDRQWSRGMPGVSNVGGGSSSDCKKDMWILWDNSWSVGISSFQDKVRPFLKALISSPQLNVGQDGTHIGIITFSTQVQTKVLMDITEGTTADRINQFLDSLNYNDISGDGTRTGMALKMASEKLPLPSPGNYRPDVSDVVMIFTDGQPIRRRGEDTFGEKYASSRNGERMLAKDRAKDLRDRDVTVVGLGVGSEITLSRFRQDIQDWSTQGKYFEAETSTLQGIIDELVSASCIDPGECTCDQIEAGAFVAQGERALINWIEPTLKCASGRQAQIESKIVQPPVSPPSEFGAGHHTVTYTYRYLRGSKVVSLECRVEINVKACECPGVTRVNAQLQSGETEATVSWTVPHPNCPASLTSVSPSGAKSGRGKYPIGEHTVYYNYEHNSAAGSISLRCPVIIKVKGVLCGGIAFDQNNEICCCGTSFERKAHYDCCGPKYYDTRKQTCKDFYTLEQGSTYI